MEELTGIVTFGKFGRGSKSEHQGIFLETSAGRYVLRRPGANAFHDPALEELVGRRITAVGEVSGYVLLLTGWQADDHR